LRRYGLSTVIGDRRRPAGSASASGPRVSANQEAETRTPTNPAATHYVDKSLAYLEVEPLFAQGGSNWSTIPS